MSFDPRKSNRDDVTTWPYFRPTIIAHDVARSRDRSTAVVGGNSPFQPRLLGIGGSSSCPRGSMGIPAPARSLKSISVTTVMLLSSPT